MRRVLVVLACLGLIAACIGGRVLHLPVRTLSADADASCRATAASLCARTETCSRPLLAFFFETRDGCERDVLDACRRFYEGPGSSTTPAACDASAIPCEQVKDLVRLRGVEIGGASVDAAFLFRRCAPTPGRYAPGEPCLTHGDCTTNVCEGLGSPGCGRCASSRREGDLCRGGSDCPPPLECHGRCVRLRDYGESCDDDNDCADGICKLGQCVQGATTIGARCDDDPCDLASALVCAPDHTCRPLHVMADGEPCDAVLKLEPDARICAGYVGAACNGVCTHDRRPRSCSDEWVNDHCTRSCSEHD